MIISGYFESPTGFKEYAFSKYHFYRAEIMEQPDLHRDFIYLRFTSLPGVVAIIIRDYNEYIQMPRGLKDNYIRMKNIRKVNQYSIRWNMT